MTGHTFQIIPGPHSALTIAFAPDRQGEGLLASSITNLFVLLDCLAGRSRQFTFFVSSHELARCLAPTVTLSFVQCWWFCSFSCLVGSKWLRTCLKLSEKKALIAFPCFEDVFNIRAFAQQAACSIFVVTVTKSKISNPEARLKHASSAGYCGSFP
jgi:hypothetical protein